MWPELIDRLERRLPPRWRGTLLLRVFGLTRVPMLLLVRPTVTTLTETRCVVRIPLNRLTRNHVGSMYLGVLTMGADVAGGLLAVGAARRRRAAIVPIFKGLTAEFLRRAEGDVDFCCDAGAALDALVQRCLATGKRVSLPVPVVASVDGVEVARFVLDLSIKPG